MSSKQTKQKLRHSTNISLLNCKLGSGLKQLYKDVLITIFDGLVRFHRMREFLERFWDFSEKLLSKTLL